MPKTIASENGGPVGGARTPACESSARRGRGPGGAAGVVVKRRDRGGELGGGPEDLAAGGGVALAGLRHAGADQLLEVLALGHRPLSFSGRGGEGDPARPALSGNPRSEGDGGRKPSRTRIPFASAGAGRRRRPVRRSGARWRRR